MTRILGIDPGSRITGFGLIELDGKKLRYVESGCIRAGSGDFAGRLKTIFDGLCEIVEIYPPPRSPSRRSLCTAILTPPSS